MPQVILQPDLVKTNDFNSERNLEEYICNNIERFCIDVLDDILISFEINKPIIKQCKFGARGKRVDLYIVCKRKEYIIELKNPKHLMENRQGIGQLLDYGREFPYSVKKELILLTTKFDLSTARTIEYYSLPIRYIYFDKKQNLEFIKEHD